MVTLCEKQLKSLYKKYNDKNVYRVSSEEYSPNIKKSGLDPTRDPLKSIRPKLEQLYDIVLELEQSGHVIQLDWHGMRPKGSFVVKVSRTDLDEPFIDFTPYWKDVLKFQRQFKGGAIATNVHDLCAGIRSLGIKLTRKNELVVTELFEWSKKKQSYANTVLVIRGTSKYLESAKFQHYYQTIEKGATQRYWESPYGRFEHFKSVITRHGFDQYEPFFKGLKFAHLRLTHRIPAKEISIR